MTDSYELVQILSDELIALDSIHYGQQLWCLANITKKKIDTPCSMCEGKLSKKSYRNLTNAYNRGDRICVNCVKRLKSASSHRKTI